MNFSRRSYLKAIGAAGVAAGAVGSTQAASDPGRIDLKIFANQELFDAIVNRDAPEPFDEVFSEEGYRLNMERAARFADHAFSDLSRAWGLQEPTVEIEFEPLPITGDPDEPDNLIHYYENFWYWARDNEDQLAADGNLLMTPAYAGGLGASPTCHFDGDKSDCTFDDYDVSVMGNGHYLLMFDAYKALGRFDDIDRSGYGDVDGDGRFEDLTKDGKLGFLDVTEFLNEHEEIGPTEWFDFDGSGRVDFLDVVDLLYQEEDFENDLAVRERHGYNSAYYTGNVVTHELGHNAGLKHNMGEMYVDDDGKTVVTVMTQGYEPDFAGQTNRGGKNFAEIDENTEFRLLPRFSDTIKAHPEWFYDETDVDATVSTASDGDSGQNRPPKPVIDPDSGDQPVEGF
jgi:hypothetical protein